MFLLPAFKLSVNLYSRMAANKVSSTCHKSSDIMAIFSSAIEAVRPETLIYRSVRITQRHLVIENKKYELHKPCYVVGFGKAVLGMATALEDVLGDSLERGVVTVPTGIFQSSKDNSNMLVKTYGRIEYVEGATDNIPDKNALHGAIKIRNLISELNKDDLLIVLISGGGSALLPLPKPPITLEEKQTLIRNLAKRGADILEINCVRKQISLLKGGGLAEVAYPAKVVSLVLSDIVGDPLDFIASGPTLPNISTKRDALDVVKKYSLYHDIPSSIKDVLERENEFSQSAVPAVNGRYIHVDNYIIGNNELAVQRARQEAETLGFQTSILSTTLTGEVERIGKMYASLSQYINFFIEGSLSREEFVKFLKSLRDDLHLSQVVVEDIINFDYTRGICLIGAGEPTVVVRGKGKGGRNQQLVLAFSVEVNKLNVRSVDISFLSGGTDGIDGPTDAAGATGTQNLLRDADMQNISAREYLDDNDSYNFFSKFNNGDNLIKIGHTGTNVMDIHLLLIRTNLNSKL